MPRGSVPNKCRDDGGRSLSAGDGVSGSYELITGASRLSETSRISSQTGGQRSHAHVRRERNPPTGAAGAAAAISGAIVVSFRREGSVWALISAAAPWGRSLRG